MNDVHCWPTYPKIVPMDIPLTFTIGSPTVSMMQRIVWKFDHHETWGRSNHPPIRLSASFRHQLHTLCVCFFACFIAEINSLLHLNYKQFQWPYCSYVVGTLKHHHHQWQFQNQVFGHYSLVTIRVGFRWEPWSQGMYRKSYQMMLIYQVGFIYTFWYFLSSTSSTLEYWLWSVHHL